MSDRPPPEHEMVQLAVMSAWIWLHDFPIDFWLRDPIRPNWEALEKTLKANNGVACNFHGERLERARWIETGSPEVKARIVDEALAYVNKPWRVNQ